MIRKIIALITIMLLCIFSGCKTQEIVRTEVVEVPRISTVEKHDTIRDSISVKDSVIVQTKGDTIMRDRWRTETKWRDRVKVVNTTDTVTQTIPVETVKYVEKKLTPWQTTRLHFANVILILIGAFVGLRVVIQILKKKGRL